MRRKAFMVVFVSLLMTSCLKDGFNDFEALKHPMSFQGIVNPSLAVPVASGSATIYDILNMVQVSYAKMEVNDQGVITLSYDTSASWHIPFNNSKPGYSAPKNSNIVHVVTNQINGSVAIDIFDNIEFLDNAQLEVDSLKVNLNAFITAQANENTLQAIETYHVHVYYDSLYLSVIGKDNLPYNIVVINDSIPIDSLIHGQNIKLFDNTDISDAINRRPKEIKYGARMNIAFEAAFFASNITENDFIADSIGVTSVDIDADVKVEFPISAYINNLSYQTDINFEPSFHLGDLVIDSSYLFLTLDNGIPLSLDVNAKFINEAGDSTEILNTTVGGAPVTNTAPYVSNGKTTTLDTIVVTKEVFDALLETKKIRVKAGLNTTDNDLQKRVSIKADDKLEIKLSALLRPSYNMNFDLGNGQEGDNQEGGSK